MQTVEELLVDAYGCRGDLSDAAHLEKIARAAVEKVGAHIASSVSHPFQPHGLTLVLVLQESHFVLSTWPEHKMVIVNIFLCNASMDAMKVWDEISSELHPEKVVLHRVPHDIGKKPQAKAA